MPNKTTDDRQITFIPEPPDYLFGNIMARIDKEQRLVSIRRRLVLYTITAGASLVGFIPALNLTRNDLLSSGFLQFASLIFSDFQIIATYSQNYFMSLIESFPTTSLLLCLAAVFFLLMSLKLITQNIKDIAIANKLINI